MACEENQTIGDLCETVNCCVPLWKNSTHPICRHMTCSLRRGRVDELLKLFQHACMHATLGYGEVVYLCTPEIYFIGGGIFFCFSVRWCAGAGMGPDTLERGELF